jgi:thiamine biosynthesis lipoprotein
MHSVESMPSPACTGPTPGRRLRRLRIALGTWVAIEAVAESEATAAGAIEAAFAAVSEVERRMHPEREGSDIARINAAPLLVQTPIHASTWEVLRLAQRLNELTRGVFDPCLPLRPGCLSDLGLSGPSPESEPWGVRRAPLVLDLGGIAKGYAIDCAVAALRAGGCAAGAVNAGGDLRLFGARRETVLLRHGDHGYQPLVLQNAALAVSDLDEPRRPPGHRGYYLRTGAAAAGRRYAAVLAPDAMIADALTKCVLLCSEERASRTVAEWGARVVTDAGRGPRR